MDAHDQARLTDLLGENLSTALLAPAAGAPPAGGAGTADAPGTLPAGGIDPDARGVVVRALVDELARTRDAAGVRRWFHHPQPDLDGMTPLVAALGITHDADPAAGILRRLAAAPAPQPRSSRDRRRMLDLVRFERGDPERRDSWRSRRA